MEEPNRQGTHLQSIEKQGITNGSQEIEAPRYFPLKQTVHSKDPRAGSEWTGWASVRAAGTATRSMSMCVNSVCAVTLTARRGRLQEFSAVSLKKELPQFRSPTGSRRQRMNKHTSVHLLAYKNTAYFVLIQAFYIRYECELQRA